MIPGVQGTVLDGGLGASGGNGVDTIVVVGPTTAGPLGSNGGPSGSPGYTAHTSTSSVIATYTSGPAVELVCSLLNIVPNPPTVLLYRTPNSVAAVLGTPDLTGFAGTALPVWSGTPLDASEQRIDFPVGGTLGVPGATYTSSWDNDRTQEPGPIALMTATSFVPPGSGLRLDLTPPASQITALVTYANDIRTKVIAHFAFTTGSVHGAADTTSGAAIHAAATDLPTAILVLTTVLTALGLHLARGTTVHLTADITTSLAAATAAATTVTSSGLGQDAITLAQLIATAFAAHEANTTVHTIADAVNLVTATPPTRGTIVAGDTIYVAATPSMPSAADIATAIGILSAGPRRFRGIATTGIITTSDFATIDAATPQLEANFDWTFVLVNTRDYTAGETDPQYVTSLSATWSTTFAADKRISLWGGFAKVVGSQGAPSVNRQIRRPASWTVARRYMENDPSIDVAEVDLGPLSGVSIVGEHDERMNGGIGGFTDPARLGTLRTYKGKSGAYVCIPWMKSAVGSDFIRVHLRAVMDLACITAYDDLVMQLNKGIPVNPKTGFLDPVKANSVAFQTNQDLAAALAQKVGAFQRPRSSGGGITDTNGKPIPSQFVKVATTDNLLVPGTPLNVQIAFVPLAYLEAIQFTIGFVNPALQALQQGGG